MEHENNPDRVSIKEIEEVDSELVKHDFFRNKDEVKIKDLLKFLKYRGSLSHNKNETRKAYNRYKKTILSKEKKDKFLIADVSYITKYTVKRVIQDCMKLNSQAAYIILLTLFTGRSLKKIQNTLTINKKVFDNNTSQIYFIYDFKLKEFKLSPEVKKQIEPTLDRIALTLPNVIFKQYKGKGIKKISSYEIDEIIKEVKSKHGIRVNLEQINRYMTFWMVNKGFDTTEIAIVNGQFEKMVSGVYYYQVPIKKINKLYQKYVEHLLGLLSINYNNPQPLQKGCVGSNLVLRKGTVKCLLNSISEKINTIKKKTLKDREYQYNLMVLYTLIILNISTGHRPVNDPYQTLKHFNLKLKTVHISDKDRGNELPYRVCLLSNLASKQMNSFIDYLKYFGENNQFLIRGIKENIAKILLGEQVLFRFLVKGKFLQMEYKHVKKMMKEFLLINQNWHRHYIRSNLPNYGVSGQQIDMWMGHEGKGSTGFSSCSSMSMKDLEPVTKAINKILQELEVGPVRLDNV